MHLASLNFCDKLPEAFETLFRMFTDSIAADSLYKGYRFLAVAVRIYKYQPTKMMSIPTIPVAMGKNHTICYI